MTKNLESLGLRSIIKDYDLIFIDIWGVVHNGVILHEKAINVLNEISKAKKDYNEDNVIDTADDLLIEPGDDFGFTETSTFFGDGKEFAPNRGVDI